MKSNKKGMKLSKEERAKVVNCCNRGLITDDNYTPDEMFPNEWFQSLFDFVDDEKIKEQLGEAFYQARFTYKLMQVLNLPQSKYRGIVKFQIIRYASICEGLLNYVLAKYFRKDFEEKHAAVKLTNCANALSGKTQIIYDGKKVIVCAEKIENAKLEIASNPTKSEYALSKGILTQNIKERYCALYDLRNNAHILKAANVRYFPQIKESKEAYALCFEFIDEIKAFCLSKVHEAQTQEIVPITNS